MLIAFFNPSVFTTHAPRRRGLRNPWNPWSPDRNLRQGFLNAEAAALGNRGNRQLNQGKRWFSWILQLIYDLDCGASGAPAVAPTVRISQPKLGFPKSSNVGETNGFRYPKLRSTRSGAPVMDTQVFGYSEDPEASMVADQNLTKRG
jgi:hypothetical protein